MALRLWRRLCALVCGCLLWPGLALANFYEVELAYHRDDSLQQTATQVDALPDSAWQGNGSSNLSLGYTNAAFGFAFG